MTGPEHTDATPPPPAPDAPAESAVPSLDRTSRRLHAAAWAVLLAVLAFFLYSAHTADPLNRAQGLLMIFLAAWPSLQWAKSADKRFPLVEVLLLTTANSYALPLLNGQHFMEFDPETITTAAWVVLTFQSSVILLYQTTTGRPRRTRFWTEEFLGDKACHYLNYGMTINTVFLALTTYTNVIPPELNSIFRAACAGIGIICSFITARLWGAGTLNSGEKTFYLINLVAQTILQIATLFLLGAISALALALVGYVTTSRRVPLVVCGSLLALLAILHNGKSAMRDVYWEGDSGSKRLPQITALPSFFAEWIGYGVRPPGAEGRTDSSKMATKLLQRTSLFQMVCLVVERTPEYEPYLGGKSYDTVLAQFVPRVFWPDKPSGLAATSMLAIYYGLQTEEGAQQTSIAFGQVAEAYANFSLLGVAALGAFFGFLYKKVQIWTSYSPTISYPGVLLVLLMAWTFQVEMTFATWISSLYQGCISVLGLLLAVRAVLR